jgi:metallo-beta-lactamase superfamily protein
LAAVQSTLTRPADDEIEISVFGPGVGECIVLHLGFGDWIVVDSCNDRDAGIPAPLAYLRKIGVDAATAVKVVVVTHWHDDHIAGSAEVVRACHQAKFHCSAALNGQEFFKFVRLHSRTMTHASGVSEFDNIFAHLRSRAPPGARSASVGPEWTIENQIIWDRPALPDRPAAELRALSPSAGTITLALHEFARMVPDEKALKRNIVAQEPNDIAVVLRAEIGPHRILLGSDLEDGPNPLVGWKKILASSVVSTAGAEVFKVAHHGSKNGENALIWSKLLTPSPIAALTPFRKSGLPRPLDIDRLKTKTPRLYMTANTRGPPPARRDAAVDRKANAVAKDRRALEGGIGHVCIRAPMTASSLKEATITLRGTAFQVR